MRTAVENRDFPISRYFSSLLVMLQTKVQQEANPQSVWSNFKVEVLKGLDVMPLLYYSANIGFGWIASLLFWRRMTDLNSGMRAYPRTMIQELSFDPSGPALPVDLLLIHPKLGFKVQAQFIDYQERIGRSTMQPLPNAWWTLKRILRTRFTRIERNRVPVP